MAMKNRFTIVVLAGLLVGVTLALTGCADVFHKEWDYPKESDGNPVLNEKGQVDIFLKSETEYRRFGDQKVSGLTATKNTPDGTQVSLAFEQQESEGKLQIEALVSALGEALAPWLGGSLTAPQTAAVEAAVEKVLAQQ